MASTDPTTNTSAATEPASVDATHTTTPSHTTAAHSIEGAKEETSSAASQDGHPEDTKPSDEKAKAGVETDAKGKKLIQGRSIAQVTLIMVALCLAVFLAALDVTIITTALPTISEYFHSSAGYTWIGSAFLLANCASIPAWGKVSDIFGRKPMILLANIIFMVGSLIAALSYNIGMLIAARAIQGLGAGGLIILVNILIGDLFPLHIRGAFYGLVGAVWAISSSIGPIIGGAFTEKVSWRWCFYINLPLDGIAFFILLFFLDVKTPKTPLIDGLKAIDWLGSLLIVGATLMFLFGLQYGGETAPWDSALVLCLIIFGVVTYILFGLWEWKGAIYPVMPMSLFGTRTNAATLACVFLHGMVFISGSYYLPLYFQAILGATPILSGVYLLPTALGLAVTSIGTGAFIAKKGWYLPPIYFGFTMMTIGYGLFIDLDAHSSWAKIIIYQIIAGAGIGTLFQSPIIALQAHIHPRDIATATATLGFVRQLATSTSVVIGQVVFQNEMNKKQAQLAAVLPPQLAGALSGAGIGANVQLIDTLPDNEKAVVREAFADSLQPMWTLYTALSALGFLIMFLIARKKLSREHEETKTGLEQEKLNAEQRKEEKARAKEEKAKRKSGVPSAPARVSQDLEAGGKGAEA